MPEVGPGPQAPVEEASVKQASATARPSIFLDPMVRRMTWIAVGLVIVFLLLVLSALLTGVIGSTGPRTLAERELAVSRAAVESGSTNPDDWSAYIAALIENRQYGRAKSVIKQGRESVNDSQTADFALAEARLYRAQKKYEDAIDAADKAMKQIKSEHDKLVAAGGPQSKTVEVLGLDDNYYDAALVKAYSYESLGEYDKAIEQFDIYIKKTAGAADILVDRGRAKIKTGDTAGAEDDFRTALKFIPNDPEALKGLDEIGVKP